MQPTLCARCHKNLAIVFIQKMEGGATKSEGLCLKCAKEMGIKPVEEMMDKMGISDDDLDGLTSEMMSAFNGAEGMEGLILTDQEPSEDDDSKTATFPFLNKLLNNAQNHTQGRTTNEETQRHSQEEKTSGSTTTKTEKNVKRKFLESYCISLTQKAEEGKLDRIVGRTEEIQRTIQILNRRQKNNPCLIGEPGVGKTAIAEGLAQEIFLGNVPYKLLNKEIYLLDLTALVAGTQFRGQFESRMKGLIDEIKKLGNIILVIDEVHNIVGAGDAEGSMNAANILKPSLSRGEIQVIGATTLTEYRKYIEKDSALERRFQPVMVEEPSIEDAVKILLGIAPYYEKFHYVSISPEMCRMAVNMSERYITDRFLPDKAIDLIDEACSDVNLKNRSLARSMEIKQELETLAQEREALMSEANERDYKRQNLLKSNEQRQADLRRELSKLSAEHNALVSSPFTDSETLQTNERRQNNLQRELNLLTSEREGLHSTDESAQDYARLATIKSHEIQLQEELGRLDAQSAPPLTIAHLARVIELWTKIPATQIEEQEYERLSKLEDRLKSHIIGQDEAVHAVSAAIRRGRVGIASKRKPVSFIFVGSTGVGKTELVKRLADDLFNTPESLIRLDMSEFMEKHSVSRIIGSPPGYVGYDEAGQLTEKVRRKPYCVILFDEIEKAHPDVLNIMLQILDDGHITDAHGRTVNFENTVIVMTSNAGRSTDSGSGGFGRSMREQGREKAIKALEAFLRPEFLNRVDEIVYFNRLSEEHFKTIAKIMLGDLSQTLTEKGITFTWDDTLLDYLTKKSYSLTYGARNLRRLIQKDLEDAIASLIIDSYLEPVSAITVRVEDDVLQFETE
ncbi:MAG: ATP-dependent Clp protease ATP-binding subunit [Oscillospiraceae bacterium]|nr:ATP-dependent Clp protease ATP-binding subunit [Oscillospiraceae bacterium]